MFTTVCPQEQQTNDNLIVKDNCFIIEIFDKFSFSGNLRRCLSHLIEAYKEFKHLPDNRYCEISYNS